MKTPNDAARGKYQHHLAGATKQTDWWTPVRRCGLTSLLLSLTSVIWGCTTPQHLPMKHAYELVKPTCERIITADVVALEQVYYYNRFGSFNPAGIMYALRRDVVLENQEGPLDIINAELDAGQDESETPIPLKPQLGQDFMLIKDKEGKDKKVTLAGQVKLRSSKRPRPLVLRANEGDCLQVTFTNLLALSAGGQEAMNDPEFRLTHPERVIDVKKGEEPIRGVIDSEEPATRHASMHVNGLSLVNSEDPRDSIESQGVNVGRNGWHQKDEHGHRVETAGRCSPNHQDFGKDLCALAAPGETRTYTWYAKKEGTYFFYSMGTPAGGEGDGGQLGLGLFGAVNVQPKNAKWYRSQVEGKDLEEATIGDPTRYGQPIIDYEKTYEKESMNSQHRIGDPILNMAKTLRQESWAEPTFEKKFLGKDEPKCEKGLLSSKDGKPMCHFPEILQIVHSDLNAVIDIQHEEDCDQQGEGNACGKPYREFTTIFHDEVTAVQAFKELDEENSPLSSLRDGMGINYGASGLGAMVLANRKKIGPSRDCVECKLEEFFLTSWVHGDPAMVVGYKKGEDGNLKPVKDKDGKQVRDANGRPLFEKEAKYPDDPSNVHHSYLGDPVRFRNMHAGPKETHVFHLHAHQWVEDKHDPSSHYLDSQTISPGATFSYEVHYGGSGNRNFGPGDSIFHCHLYPHFAQGMWELWRTHDVFENGGKDRRLPDHEIEEGTPNPAIVPLPGTPLPPMPVVVEKIKDGKKIVDDSKSFRGYPFYIAAEKGHRPPQAPRDLDPEDHAQLGASTLRRHVIVDGVSVDGTKADEPRHIIEDVRRSAKSGADPIPPRQTKDGKPVLYEDGKNLSDYTARRVFRDNQNNDFFGLARQLTSANIEVRSEAGTGPEQVAMQFHAGTLTHAKHGAADKPGKPGWTHTQYNWEAPGYPSCLSDGTCDNKEGARVLFRVNGGGNIKEEDRGKGEPGAPFSNPCPNQFVDEKGHVRPVMTREYRTAYIQMDMTVNKAGWHDPQARLPVLEEDLKATLDGTRPTEPLFFRANSGECIVFKATNLIPSNLNLDDFQVYSPTDTMGQHIHLVKFDVTSSDGSGNGWNYEDGTLAADEVRERIVAHNRYAIEHAQPGETPELFEPKTHRLFTAGGAMPEDPRGICPPSPMKRLSGETTSQWVERWEKWGQNAALEHPWCGAQTTIQRWWADPLLNSKPGEKGVKDRTLRTVFTHDHFGPSSHQHHGFYAALVIEPRNSKWFSLDGQDMGGTDENGKAFKVKERQDGGPTSYAANIIARDEGKACLNMKTLECSHQLDNKDSIDRRRTGREFNLAFADFAIVYTSDKQEDEPEENRLRPVNPPNHIEGGVLNPEIPGHIPSPEGISTKDPGTQLINYRNEPIPLRIGKRKVVDSDTKVPSPWSCLPVKGKPEKKSCFIQKDELKVVDSKVVDSEHKIEPPWSCTRLEKDPSKKLCVIEKNIGDMAHVFSSQVHNTLVLNHPEKPDERGKPIFTECLLGVCPKDLETSDLKKRDENAKKMAKNKENQIGRQNGDPATPLLQAYDGDRVQIRLIQGAQEEQHVFTMHGARWLTQPDAPNSGYVNAQHIGISEHFEFNDRILGLSNLPTGALGHGIEAIPCKQSDKKPCRTDLLFNSSAMDNLWDGQWGLMRIYPAEEKNLNHILARLPGNTDKNPFTDALRGPGLDERLDSVAVEPPSAKEEKRLVHDPVEAFCKDPARKDLLKPFSIEAWMAKDLLDEKGLVYNKKFGITDPDAILFVERKHVSGIQRGARRIEPLILRARAGDCIEVTLTNHLLDKMNEMPDDPSFLNDGKPLDDLKRMKIERWQKTWSYNILPPIIEGFNFNQLRSSNRVGLHAGLVDQNLRRDDGAHIGFNEDSTVKPGESRTYLWYAGDLTGRKGGIRERPIEFGVIPLTDQADVIKHPAHGAIGALVIEPQCSKSEVDPESNAVATVIWWESEREVSGDGKHRKASWCQPEKPTERTKMSPFEKKIHTATTPALWPPLSIWPTDWSNWWHVEDHFEGVHRFKEFVLLYQDALALQQYGQPLPNLRNGDDAEDSGQKAFNYRTEPLWARLGASAADEPDVMSEYDWSNVLSSRVPHEGCPSAPCDPETPIFEVDAGDSVRFRVVHPGGHPRMHALAIFGHNWSLNPWTNHSSVMGWNEDSPTRFGATNGIGPARHLNIVTRAGGDCAVPGDYLYRTQEGFMFGGGLWGILRVNEPKDPSWWRPGIHPQNLIKQDPNVCRVDVPKADTAAR